MVELKEKSAGDSRASSQLKNDGIEWKLGTSWLGVITYDKSENIPKLVHKSRRSMRNLTGSIRLKHSPRNRICAIVECLCRVVVISLCAVHFRNILLDNL